MAVLEGLWRLAELQKPEAMVSGVRLEGKQKTKEMGKKPKSKSPHETARKRYKVKPVFKKKTMSVWTDNSMNNTFRQDTGKHERNKYCAQ